MNRNYVIDLLLVSPRQIWNIWHAFREAVPNDRRGRNAGDVIDVFFLFFGIFPNDGDCLSGFSIAKTAQGLAVRPGLARRGGERHAASR